MRRIALVLAALGILACGGQESEGPTRAAPAETPAKAAAATPAPATPNSAKAKRQAAAARRAEKSAQMPPAPRPELEHLSDPTVKRCLALIREGNYDEAKVACTEAAQIYPDNEDIEAALQMAEFGDLGPS